MAARTSPWGVVLAAIRVRGRPDRRSYVRTTEWEVDVLGGQKKRGGRVTPKGGAPFGRLSAAEKAGLEDIFARLLRSAGSDLTDDLEPLGVELWASQLWCIWDRSELVGMDAVEVFAGGLIAYATKRATEEALRAMLALGAVAPELYGAKARRAAARLARRGIAKPSWSGVVGRSVPNQAWLSYDPVDDDGVNVMVEFDGLGGAHTVGLYIDHNLRGLAKDVFAVPAGTDEVIKRLRDCPDSGEVLYRQISVAEAAARWRVALEATDMTIDAPVAEDLHDLRALVLARLAKMPARARVPQPLAVGEGEREQLLVEFLESDETIGLWGVEKEDKVAAEHLAMQVMTFGLDYVEGSPLRFSPVMVEIFCLDWAPRKIAADEEAFGLLPDVLAAWIRFAGRRRGISQESISEAVAATYDYAPEMIELSRDPENWGPAKTVVLAIQERGIDITDQESLDRFIKEVNANGGIDVLTDSLVGSRSLTR